MKKTISNLLLMGILVPLATHAYVNCDGSVNNFQVTSQGIVQVSSENIWGDSAGRAVCSVSEEWKGVKTEACKGWISILLFARLTQQPIRVQYVDGTSCSEVPTWGHAIAPVMINTK